MRGSPSPPATTSWFSYCSFGVFCIHRRLVVFASACFAFSCLLIAYAANDPNSTYGASPSLRRPALSTRRTAALILSFSRRSVHHYLLCFGDERVRRHVPDLHVSDREYRSVARKTRVLDGSCFCYFLQCQTHFPLEVSIWLLCYAIDQILVCLVSLLPILYLRGSLLKVPYFYEYIYINLY